MSVDGGNAKTNKQTILFLHLKQKKLNNVIHFLPALNQVWTIFIAMFLIA